MLWCLVGMDSTNMMLKGNKQNRRKPGTSLTGSNFHFITLLHTFLDEEKIHCFVNIIFMHESVLLSMASQKQIKKGTVHFMVNFNFQIMTDWSYLIITCTTPSSAHPFCLIQLFHSSHILIRFWYSTGWSLGIIRTVLLIYTCSILKSRIGISDRYGSYSFRYPRCEFQHTISRTSFASKRYAIVAF